MMGISLIFNWSNLENSIISALNWIKRKIVERRCAFVSLLTIINISQCSFDLYRMKLLNFSVSKNQSFETTVNCERKA